MNLQKIYDKVKNHLLTQNRKSVKYYAYGTYHCRYRSDDGAKCAIGCLIPDSWYDPMMENLSVNDLYHDKFLNPILNSSVGKLTPIKMDLLMALQGVHDDSEPSAWKRRFKQVANKFKLNP